MESRFARQPHRGLLSLTADRGALRASGTPALGWAFCASGWGWFWVSGMGRYAGKRPDQCLKRSTILFIGWGKMRETFTSRRKLRMNHK
jgi:hypothetical protein